MPSDVAQRPSVVQGGVPKPSQGAEVGVVESAPAQPQLWAYAIPNLITLAGMLCGIYMAVSQAFSWPLFLACCFADFADGTAARLLKASSYFGAVMDSVGDGLNFVIVPAILLQDKVTSPWWAAAFILSGIGRLILFTLGTYDPAPGVSIGLPTPAAAGVLFLTAFLFQATPTQCTWVLGVITLAMHVPVRVWKPSLGKDKAA